MPSHSGPRTLGKENLEFALDAADAKNSMLPSSTLLDMSSWGLGSGGTGVYSANGGTDENERVNGTDPWGSPAIVWESRPNGSGGADGGWNTSYRPVDNQYTYRYSVWVKRTSSTTSGTFYLGMNGAPIRNDNNAVQGNPYFTYTATSLLTQDQWYLVVSHVFYEGYDKAERHPDSGWYENGIKISDKSYGNIGAKDSRWQPGVTSAQHRTYHYYCGDNTTRLQWLDPRMDKCDGTEPTISDLLKASPANARNLVGTGKVKLTNGTLHSRENGGKFQFDGVSDYLEIPSKSFTISQPWSFSLNVKTNTAISSAWKNLIGATGDTDCMWMLHPGGFALYQAYYNSQTYIWWSGINVANMLVNTWNSITITCAPVNSTTTYFTSYLNGTRISQGNFTWAPINNTQVFSRIGGNGSRYFHGEIGSARIYNRALTSQEVKKNYKQHKTRFNLS